MCIIFFILIIKVCWVLPPVGRLGHTRWDSNKVLVAFGLLVSFIQSAFALRCEEIAISLARSLHLLPILIKFIAEAIRCRCVVLGLLTASTFFLIVLM